jgi:succinate dehydrogenase / fumarate reductase cytochrome b subunit
LRRKAHQQTDSPVPLEIRALANFETDSKGKRKGSVTGCRASRGFDIMAQASPAASRPLSPHLQIWRWGPGMVSSILHRATGIGATVGIAVLLWWLGALVSGPEAYATFTGWMWADLSQLSWSGGEIFFSVVKVLLKLVMIGVSWAVIGHAVTGLRHFVLDTGAGYELKLNNAWATACTVLGFVLTALFWAVLLLR